MDQIKQKWSRWHYKNTFFLIISLILFFYFADSPFIQNLINNIGQFGYVGAVIAGILFVSIFTVAPAVAVLYHLAEILNPWAIALMAGVGAVLGDYIIFRFLKDKVFQEIAPLINKMGGSFIKKVFYTPYFSWFIPMAGAFIIASPLPDEVGVGMIGLSKKMKVWHFLLITFVLNAIGIFFVVVLARSK